MNFKLSKSQRPIQHASQANNTSNNRNDARGSVANQSACRQSPKRD